MSREVDAGAGEIVPGRCAEHGGLMWSNAMRACITPDDVIRGGCRWQPFEADENDPQIDYDGPDPSVECAYPPCTNRLRRFGIETTVPQWCSRAHRLLTSTLSRSDDTPPSVPVGPSDGTASSALSRGPAPVTSAPVGPASEVNP